MWRTLFCAGNGSSNFKNDLMHWYYVMNCSVCFVVWFIGYWCMDSIANKTSYVNYQLKDCIGINVCKYSCVCLNTNFGSVYC